MELLINGRTAAIPPGWQDERLLWVLREALGLVGCKQRRASPASIARSAAVRSQ